MGQPNGTAPGVLIQGVVAVPRAACPEIWGRPAKFPITGPGVWASSSAARAFPVNLTGPLPIGRDLRYTSFLSRCDAENYCQPPSRSRFGIPNRMAQTKKGCLL